LHEAEFGPLAAKLGVFDGLVGMEHARVAFGETVD
jgi:hypothetical protein